MEDLDNLILQEIKDNYKTIRRICEDLSVRGIEADPTRVDVRLRSFRKAGMVSFIQIETAITGPKPLAYKLRSSMMVKETI